VLIDFLYENDLVALGRKSLLKKDGLALGGWYPFERKLNAHERENNKVWSVEIDFKWMTNI